MKRAAASLRHLAADILEMQIHRLRVGIRQDQGRTDIAMRADSAEYVAARPRRESMYPADQPELRPATKVQSVIRAHVQGLQL
jgi:hypothetical protein